jgi:hypothetical protein
MMENAASYEAACDLNSYTPSSGAPGLELNPISWVNFRSDSAEVNTDSIEEEKSPLN